MPTDPNIVLAAGNIGSPTPEQQTQGLISMFSLAQGIKQSQQETAKKNALLSTFSDPNSVDPTTGAPTPQAIQKVMTVDPELGLKLRSDSLDAQVKRAQLAHSQTEIGKSNFDFMSGVAGVGYDAYDAAKKAGKSETDAIADGQAARNEAAKNNGGVVGDDIADGITSKPFDPAGARALAGTNKEWSAQRHQTETENIAQERLDQANKHEDARESESDRQFTATMARVNQAGDAKWQVLTDPKTQTQYRYNPETGQSTSLNGKDTYEPGGAAKISSGVGPRSAASAYIQKYMTENPNATSADIAGAASNFAVEQSEGRTVGTRSGAADVAANEVSVFAKQAMDASKAVKRPDLKLLTTAIQAGETQDSDPNLQKLLIATDALVNARARAISPSGSPHVSDQIEGRRLLSTLIGEKGYEAGVEQFQKEAEGVLESTRQSKKNLLDDKAGSNSADAKTPSVNAVADKSAYDALAKGAWYSKPGDPPGTHRVKQ